MQKQKQKRKKTDVQMKATYNCSLVKFIRIKAINVSDRLFFVVKLMWRTFHTLIFGYVDGIRFDTDADD